MSLIGKQAPEWFASAYCAGKEVQLTSKQYFYPLDFTFICPTEIKSFQAMLKEFEQAEISIIGASTDSYHSHNAWFADRTTFPEPITHAVLADTSHNVSKAFNVLNHEMGVAYRATLIIDGDEIIRSVSINDLGAGRSPSETLRTVLALQSGGLCGVDWQPGDSFAA